MARQYLPCRAVPVPGFAQHRLDCLEWRIYVTPADPSIPTLTGFRAGRVPNKSRQAKLSWKDPGDNSLTYEYGHRTPSIHEWSCHEWSWTAIPGSDVAVADGRLSYTITGLSCGWEDYLFRIRARDGDAIGPHVGLIHFAPGIYGTGAADILTGDDGRDCIYGQGGDDTLHGSPGADALIGGDGKDVARYTSSKDGVSINLATGEHPGDAKGDTFNSIEIIGGSHYHGDILIGDDADNILWGLDGHDKLEGGAGADRLNGGFGYDQAQYTGSDAAVTVNLATGIFSGGHAQGTPT